MVADIHFLLAQSYHACSLDNHDKCLSHLHAASEIFSETQEMNSWAKAMLLHGIISFELDRTDEAIQSLNLSLLYLENSSNNWAKAKFMLALLYMNQSNTEATIQCLLECMQVYNLKKSPQKWADIQVMIATALLQRTVARVSNLKVTRLPVNQL
jgi:tetratricopeptide (TPR) repeat protein